ncbi:MAG: DUF2764 domain-containing protein [Alistipes sp.]|jgi:hypothetical protein|nr:DUF2764 domain-containing protein [Alistipes sp.]
MLGGRQYYGLVSGVFREYSPATAAEKSFDADAIYGEIRRELSSQDRRTAGVLWSLMEIYGLGRDRIEHLYKLCATSGCDFLRQWGRFDRNLRNVIAAHTARAKGRSIPDSLLGDDGDEIVLSLAKSTAADFNLRGELDYIDRLLTALGDVASVVDKERTIDMIRWEKADSLSEFDSFGMATVLAYLVKVAVIGRWASLDPATGREMYNKLVNSMDRYGNTR